MAQKFYQKATVQAAIVNAIPTIVAAFIGVVSIYLTYRISYKGFRQTSINFDRQFLRDSLSSIRQDSMAILQTSLNQSQTKLAKDQFENDSVFQSREILIQRNQLQILKLQQHENDVANETGLDVSKIELRNYPLKIDYTQKPFDLKEVFNYYGFEPELIYDHNSGKSANVPTIGQSLVVYNRKNSSVVPGMPLLFTKNEVVNFLTYKNLQNGLNDSLEIVKKFLVDIEVENNSKLPITVLSSSFLDVKCNPQQQRRIDDTMQNNKFLNPSKKAAIAGMMIYALCCKVQNQMEVDLEIHYKTIYGVRIKHFLYKYDSSDNSFSPYD